MALNKERYHLVGTPRVYCDLTSYLKSIGKKSIRHSNWSGNGYSSQLGNINWDMNPARQRTEVIDYAGQETGGDAPDPQRHYMSERITFMEELGVEDVDNGAEGMIGEPLSLDLRKLINNVNYFGVLGHNMHTLADGTDEEPITIGTFPHNWNNVSTSNTSASTSIVGVQHGDKAGPNGDGFFLATINEPLHDSGDEYCHGYRLNFYTTPDPVGKVFELGAITAGYYFDFPHSPNLSVSIAYDFDGIKRKRTIGGSDLTQINYLKPNWGRFAPFANTFVDNNQDLRDVGLQGRRIITMNFDFINESDMFPKNIHQNTFVQDKYTDGAYQGFDYDDDGGNHSPNMLGNYLNLSLGGNVNHLLQLDSEQHDFVLVKLDGKATSITQKSPNLYSVKLKFIEQF